MLENNVPNLPFMGNRVFDVSYSNDHLWLAYWGARRLDVFKDGKRSTIASFTDSFLPHAVATGDNEVFVLASKIKPGHDDAIEPLLFRFKNKTQTLIWGEEKNRKAITF